jgi:hypothetical protein
MALPLASVEWAIRSLDRHGDTDLFPRLAELRALVDRLPFAAAEIAKLDLSAQYPSASRRFIVPKDDLSYRAATQLDVVDSVIFTAIMHEHGKGIESRRRPIPEQSVFSYRFAPSTDGELYPARSSWNDFWQHCLNRSAAHHSVLIVDIADFYNQIYHHTIENQLIESGFPNAAIKWVIRLCESITAKVSRGIPIGPHPAHLIAEATMIPVDNSLASRGIQFARYVDDIVVFAESSVMARKALYEVATVLDKQQRLQLQRGKTQIMPASEFQSYCRSMIADRPINATESELLNIIKKYSGGDPYRTISVNQLSAADMLKFTSASVNRILEEYLATGTPDYVRLRWFIRRLAQVGHPAAVEFCLQRAEDLIPALSEVCHYFISVGASSAALDWPSIGSSLLALLESELIQSNEYFQLSILSLFTRQPQLNHIAKLVGRYESASPATRREVILAAAAGGAADWLRERKEEIGSMDPWTRSAFLFSTHTLPPEERRFFLKFATPRSPSEELVAQWAKA